MASVFERSVWIPAHIDELFQFHLDPSNLTRISPPSLRLLRLEKPARPEVGSRIKLQVRQFFWTQTWEVIWDVIQPPAGRPLQARLVDRAIRSPFASWQHEHFFQEDGAGCLLTDRLHYRLPWEPWSQPAEPFVRFALDQMFIERHRRTVAHFSALGPGPSPATAPASTQENTERSELPKSPST